MFGLPRHECIVQEFFVNRQRSGSWTNPHTHRDDFFGGIYYLDADSDTLLCYDNNQPSRAKRSWQTHAANFVADLGPAQYSGGFAKVESGDILLAPVNWLEHWVPAIEKPNTTRTSIVF